MKKYIIKRILLIFPTLFFIMLLNFAIIQAAPGGPVEQFLAKMTAASKAHGEVTSGGFISSSQNLLVDEKIGEIDQEIIEKINKLYGFDQPFWTRFWLMLKKFAVFDFGESFYADKKVIDLVLEKLPVSISLGLWTTLLVYLISI